MHDVSRPIRSWLFAPGHSEKLVSKVFACGADAVILDLEDAVPESLKARARELVANTVRSHRCWVRVNRPGTEDCERDLAAVAEHVEGLRLPKVGLPAELEWAARRAPGVPLDCSIESALGVVNAYEIASSPACTRLSYGGLDLASDLRVAPGEFETLFARSSLVVAARAAGRPAPSDGVCVRLNDDDTLRRECEGARRLGFFGKSAIHPRQVSVINAAFEASAPDVAWAERVVAAFEASGGAATQLADGEFVDLAVVRRAQQLLDG